MRDILNLYDCSKGHTWVFYGGCNAGCDDDCACSVPVHKCAHCGDYDYGQNEEAEEVRRDCRARYEMLNPPMENSGETGNAWAVPAMTGPLPVAGTPTNSTPK